MLSEAEIKRGIKADCNLPVGIAKAVAEKKQIAYELGKRHLREEIERRFEEHRKKAFISCSETCFCWDVEPFL